MKKLLFPIGAVLIVAFVLAGCGKTAQGQSTPGTGGSACTNGTVEMASTTFVQSTCTIKAGEAVKFVDPAGTGNVHILCLGKNQQCQSNPDGPAELNTSSGVTFQAGEPPKSYTFAKAGTYTVTCTIHPNMDVTITVQ